MDDRGNGEVPGSVGGHTKTEEGPYSVIVEGRNEHRGCTACSEYVSPGSLVEPVVDVVYVAVLHFGLGWDPRFKISIHR